MLKADPRDYAPTEDKLYGMYRGVVEDNKTDPLKMGRCKIRVFGIHTKLKEKDEFEGVPTEELPWAEPALGLFEGAVSGFGGWTVPLQGSHVFLFFENGNIMQPRFFASIPGQPKDKNHGFKDEEGFSDPDEEYPIEETEKPHKPNQLEEPDWHRLAREDTADTIVEHKNKGKDKGVSTALGKGETDGWDEPDSYYAAKYPHNKVFATHTGITVEIDDTPGEERIHIYHPSKSYIEIDKDGNIVVRNAKDKFEIVDNNKKQHIKSNLDRTVDTNRTSKVGADEFEDVGGNREVKIGGNEKADIGGDYDRTVGGSRTDSTSGTHTVTASTIFLN